MDANKRLVPIEIDGTQYYLNCGLGCLSDVFDKYGGLDEAMSAMQGDGGNPVAASIFMLYAMLRDGTEYMRLIKGQADFPELSEKAIRLLVGMDDLEWIMPKLTLAMNSGKEREVEVKPDPKNGKAAGSKKASRGTITTQKESA